MAKSLFLQYIFNEADLKKKDCPYLHPPYNLFPLLASAVTSYKIFKRI